LAHEPHREGFGASPPKSFISTEPFAVDSVRPDQGADIYVPDLFAPASHIAVTAAWIAGAITVAYVLGLGLSWIVQRLSGRSAILRDIAHLTRRPVRATLMVIAASAAVRRVCDPASSWRGWVDHALVIVLIGTITWLLASLVMVAERRAISRFAGGDAGLTDATGTAARSAPRSRCCAGSSLPSSSCWAQRRH
jgi:hypothetical protein